MEYVGAIYNSSPSKRDQQGCRRGELTDAMGWLKLGLMDAVGTGEGWCVELHTRKTQKHTRFTQVQGPREEVKPLLLLV